MLALAQRAKSRIGVPTVNALAPRSHARAAVPEFDGLIYGKLARVPGGVEIGGSELVVSRGNLDPCPKGEVALRVRSRVQQPRGPDQAHVPDPAGARHVAGRVRVEP